MNSRLIQKLTLIGSAPVKGIGNDFSNVLTGSWNSNANILSGGKGDDTYILDAGDTVVEQVGEGFDQVEITYFTGGYQVETGSQVERFKLQDNAGASALLGNNEGNELWGNRYANRLKGGAGNDLLRGNEGNDRLIGGAGNDQLFGGYGSDRYYFNEGDGHDVINDYGLFGVDRLIFGEGIVATDITHTRDGYDLLLNHQNGTDSIRIENWFSSERYQVEQVLFSDGVIWDVNELADVANNPPTLVNYLLDQTVAEDSLFNFQIPNGTFTDEDAGDTLALSATLLDGSALPGWLSFDANSQTFSGTPDNDEVGTLSVKVTATDNDGLSVADTFALTVSNSNDAPELANSLVDQSAIEDRAFSFILPTNSFSDVDVGDALTLSASLANGSVLPVWLSFDAMTQTFFGTPGNGDIGTVSVKVTAIDNAGATVSDRFDIDVLNINTAPIISNPISDGSTTEDNFFTFTLPANVFSDIDAGDTLTLSATLSDGAALPSWLNFDLNTQTFSGTPGNDAVGLLDIKVTATDNDGLTVTDLFALTVDNSNDAPELANSIADQSVNEDRAFNFVLPANTFTDIDVDVDDVLTLSATLTDGSALPGWLSFDVMTRTFSGTLW